MQVAGKIAQCNIADPETKKSRNLFVAAIVARSRSRFHFSQRSSQRCNEFFQRCVEVLHLATLVQLVLQWRNKIARRQVAREIA